MASRYDDEELKAARESLKSLSAKSEALYRSGGNLDRNGEPSLTAERGDGSFNPSPRDANKEARSNMRGVDGLDFPPKTAFTLGDRHITGDTGGRAVRQQRPTSWAEPETKQPPEEAARRFTKLNLPAARPLRPSNENGATSFHFAHEAISKTRIEKTTARGTKNRKGAAKDHVSYIERDGAVAKTDPESLEQIQAELLEQAKRDPDIARQLGINPDDDQKPPTEAVQSLSDDLSAGGKASVYIEREEALAHDTNGSAVLYSNISSEAEQRHGYWKRVERSESDPSSDRMKLRIAGNEDFWEKVAADKDCPKALKTAIGSADPNEIVHVRTRDNDAVRKVMKRHGWKSRERRPANETDAQKIAREEREAATAFGAKFEDGRGGRVQFRVVGELPHEVSHEARVRILKDFTQEFEARNLPYIAVMHAPDHTNDDRNWHFHLVYHDRPAKRFTGKAEDHLWDLEPGAGEKKIRQHEIAQQALADPAIQKYIGEWDFAVPWSYKRADRHTVTSTPFAQPKDRDCNKRDFVPMLRRTLAQLTNRELEAEGIDRRVDPRRYSEMGIHKDSDEHLGTQAASLENAGVPTETGIKNELNQWEFIQRRLASQARADQARIDKQVKAWNAALRSAQLSDKERSTVESQMVRWEQSERVAAEHRAIATNIAEHMDRLRSRANKVAKVSARHLSAINKGKANKRQTGNKARYEAKLSEAEIHLAGIQILMGQEIKQIANSEAAAERHGQVANAARLIIEGNIAAGRDQRMKTERAAIPAAANENQRQPEAANDTDRATAATSNATSNGIPPVGNSRLESFLQAIDKHGRRLVQGNQGIIPRDFIRNDGEVIDAPNYDRAQERLAKMKAKQDSMIHGLAAAIAANPGMVQIRSEEARTDKLLPMAERFKLATKDRTHQAAFTLFGDEPEISAEIAKAEARILRQREGKAGSISAKASPPEAKPRTPVAPQTEKAAPAPTSKKAANDHSKIIDIMRTRYLRPKIAEREGAIEIAFSKQDAALFNLPASVIVDDERSISRITGIARTHDRSMKRLTAYIAKNPSKVDAGQGGAGHSLSQAAPDELVQIAENFSRDPELERLMQNAVVKARLEAADPRKDAASDKAKPAQPEKTDENDYGLFKIENGQIVMGRDDVPEVDLEARRNYEPSAYGSGKPKSDREPGDPKREPRTIKVDTQRAHELASQDEPVKTRKLKRGIDPLFDRWMDANRDGNREQRVALSERIRSDERLRKIAETFEPGTADTFQADWQQMEDRNRSGRPATERGIGQERKPE